MRKHVPQIQVSGPTEKVFLVLFGIFAAVMLIVSLLPPSVYGFLTVEDGPVENASAIFAFLGAYFCLRIFFMRKKLLGRNDFLFIVIGLMFLFVGLEEISWGQRIIGLKPVLVADEANYQREFNLHNLKNADVLIYFGGFAFLVLATAVLPLVTYFSPRVKQLCLNKGIPLMPRTICASMWLGCLLMVLKPQLEMTGLRLFELDFDGLYEIRELREFYFVFILFAYIFVDYFHILKNKKPYGG